MQTQMKLIVYGVETGIYEDKDNKSRTPWAAFHIADSFDGKDNFGMRTRRMKCSPEAANSVKGAKFPATVNANVSMSTRKIEGSGELMDIRVVTAAVETLKAA